MRRRLIFFIFVFTFTIQAMCYNDILRATHPLYGLTTVLESLNNLNSSCFTELNQLRKGVEDQKVWALKALDSSGQIPTGFLNGNNLWVGSHFQCQQISNTKKLEVRNDKIAHMETEYDFPPFPMSFAMVYFQHNSTLQYHTRMPLEWIIQLGVCVPSTCGENEIKTLYQKYVEGEYMEFQKLYNISLKVINVRELIEDSLWIFRLPKTIALLVIFGTIICLAIIGTTLDVKQRKYAKRQNLTLIGTHNILVNAMKIPEISKDQLNTNTVLKDITPKASFLNDILKCFSVNSNIKSFVRTRTSSDSIAEIHGLRFLGMGWVILVHAVFFQGDYIINAPDVYRISETFLAQIFTNSTYCVDTYLFLSGFLLAYLFLKIKMSSVKENEPQPRLTKNVLQFFIMYIHRFLRLTPTYMLVLLLTNVLNTYFSKTSALMSSERSEILCDQYWWRNLLYINNLYPRSEMCMSWSWYLSLDTQFFTIGSFLLLLSSVAFNVSAAILMGMILINFAATAYKSYQIRYIPTMDDQLVQLDAIYDLPWNRIAPYLVGIITAYLLVVKLEKRLHLTKWTRRTLWVVFPSINLWVLFTLYTRQLSPEFSAFYMAVSRALWAVGLAWLLIACQTGNAKLLRKVLSFRGYIPLSRLTYCAYLLNPLVVTIAMMGSETPSTASLSGFAVSMVGNLSLTFLASFVFSMLCESPFIRLTQVLLTKLKNTKRTKEGNETSQA